MYNGSNGKKIGVYYKDKLYMLKFPPKPSSSKVMSYTNGCLNEYVACHIFSSLGFNTQNTLLGKYNEKIVVACEDFVAANDNNVLADFASLKNTIIVSTNNGYGTELDDILDTIKEQTLIETEELLKFFWRMFIADAFLGNFDRHNGNWGFIINKKFATAEIAPIFDCGSCLYPQLTDTEMANILNSQEEIDKRIFVFPNSAVRVNSVKINYMKFILTTDCKDCLEALKYINSQIDFDVIDNIIDNTPYISDIYKNFMKRMLRERKKKILDVRDVKSTNMFK
jgi:hypothetical protein